MYHIDTEIGLVVQSFTLKKELHMKVWVVTTIYGTVVGVYSSLRKAQTAREVWMRNSPNVVVISECEVNEHVAQDEGGAESPEGP